MMKVTEDNTVYIPMKKKKKKKAPTLAEAVLSLDDVISGLLEAKADGAQYLAFGVISDAEGNRYGADWLEPLDGDWAWATED